MKELKDRPYFFDEGLRFACRQCGACCTGEPGIIFVREDEIDPICAFLGLDREIFLSRCCHPWQDGYTIREAEEGRCLFYENGCSIYSVRPRQCRTWPFWFQNLRNEAAWNQVRMGCPGVGQGRLYGREEILELMGETLEDYQRTLRELYGSE